MSRRRMVPLKFIVVAAVVVCALSGVSAVTQTVNAADVTADLTVEVQDAKSALTAAETGQLEAEKKLDAAQAEHDARVAVLAERPAFLAAVRTAAGAFDAAQGKVDVAAQRAAVLDAQQAVLAEKTDPANVAAQTAAVLKAAEDVSAAVMAHDDRAAAEAAARRAAQDSNRGASTAPTPSGGGSNVGWLADFRQRLNNVGGSHVQLIEFDGQCGSVWAVACAVPGVIKVNASIASYPESRKNWVAVHELAHQYHFGRWDDINSSAGYKRLFGSDPELLANCMASSRGYTDHGHNGQCNGERLTWAAQIWNGNVPR